MGVTLSRSQRRPLARVAQPTDRPRKPLPWALLALCVCWGLASTGYAVMQGFTIDRMADEAAVRQAEHESKVRALTRRLVGVASSQALEQDGLAERLTDIITRQVELENRDAALASTLERALAGSSSSPADAPGPTEGPVQPQFLRKGAATERIFAGRTPREQFDAIEARLGRLEARQFDIAGRFRVVAHERIKRVRAAFDALQLPIAADPEPLAPRAAPSPPPSSFRRALIDAEAALDEAGRWRALAETVPLRAPISEDVSRSSNFGLRADPFTGERRMHAGMDFRSPIGTSVHATASGRVVTAGVSGGYGTLVELDHGHGLVTRYAHLSSSSVSVGQNVAPGTIVGAVGSTGRSTGPHLHYETRLSGNPLDPLRFLTAGETMLRVPERTNPPPEVDTAEPAD